MTAQGGMALLAEFNHGLGVCWLADRDSAWSREPSGLGQSVLVARLILLRQGGGRSLDALCEWRRAAGLLRLLGREALPDPDTRGAGRRRGARAAIFQEPTLISLDHVDAVTDLGGGQEAFRDPVIDRVVVSMQHLGSHTDGEKFLHGDLQLPNRRISVTTQIDKLKVEG